MSAGFSQVLTPRFRSAPNIGLDVFALAAGKDVRSDLAVAVGMKAWEFFLTYYPSSIPQYGAFFPAYVYVFKSLSPEQTRQTLLFGRVGMNLWAADPEYANVSVGVSRDFSVFSAAMELTYVHERSSGMHANWLWLKATVSLGGWYLLGARAGTDED